MASHLDQILDHRKQREAPAERRRSFVASVISHGLVVAAAWLVPNLWAKPPEPFKAVAMTVVPPSMLGEPEPQVIPPTQPPEEIPEVKPVEPPPPPPEVVEPDVPKLVEERKEVEPAPPPPPKAAPPPPPVRQPPPKRQGSPFGKALGASNRNTTIGVEDPNFTYGYYLDRVVAAISQRWTRPLADPKAVQATFYFRIQGDGSLSELRLVTTSGSDAFDRAAEKAVQAATPFPPLPKQYTKKFDRDYLGIHLIIK